MVASKSGGLRETSQEERETDDNDDCDDVHSVDMRSILAGGNLMGWTPDVAVVMWRRLLGILGDINTIKEPSIHEQVLENLCDFVETLLKVSLCCVTFSLLPVYVH